MWLNCTAVSGGPVALVVTLDMRYLPHAPRPDACPDCGDSLRPDVVLFGEMLPALAFERAAAAAANCELCFVIGTSGIVYPAAGLPEIARGFRGIRL